MGKANVVLMALIVMIPGCVLSGSGSRQQRRNEVLTASAEGYWEIIVNGASSRTISMAEACRRAGIAEVRLLFYEGTDTYTYPYFTFACSRENFDSRPYYVLSAGPHTVRWQALDSAGNTLGESGLQDLPVPADVQHYIMTKTGRVGDPVATFVVESGPKGTEASFNATWDIKSPMMSDNTLELRCMRRGISKVAFEFTIYDPGRATPAAPEIVDEVPCTNIPQGEFGTYRSPVPNLAFGIYTMRYLFRDAAGNVIGTSSATNMVIERTLVDMPPAVLP